MAFNFKSLEQYFLASEKSKQPIGTTVDPLGKFAPRPIQQQFSRAINFPTQKPNAPFSFIPGYSTSKLAELVKGKEIEGRDKAFSLEGQAFDPRDKAFSKKGPDFTTQKINIDKNQLTFTTQKINTKMKSISFTTKNPSLMSMTPEKSTISPLLMPATQEKSTINPINPMAITPVKSTKSINQMSDVEHTTQDIIPIKAGKPFKAAILKVLVSGRTHISMIKEIELIDTSTITSDRKSIFGFDGRGGYIQHLNNFESGFMSIEPNPDKRDGTSTFKFSEKMTRSGTSYQTFTRLQYNKHFARVKPSNAPWTGNEEVPAGVTDNIRSMRLSDGDLKNKFHKRINGNPFVDLRTEAERNNPRTPLWSKAPLIQRGMQRGRDNPSSPGFLPSLDPVDGAIGLITAPLIDTLRVAKYLISPGGLLFMLKNFGLQLTNPRSEWLLGLHRGRIFNPLAFALQVPLTQFGIHIDRHYLGPFNTEKSKYEKLVFDLNTDTPLDTTSITEIKGTANRLVQLLEEMSTGILGVGKSPGSKINVLSGIMGPNSFFGIGATNHHKHTSGRDIFYADDIWDAAGTLYEPETPYRSALAWGVSSEASKGTDLKKDGPFEKSPHEFSRNPNLREPGGAVDPTGTNQGSYLTSTYAQLMDGVSNHPFATDEDAADKYGNSKLQNYVDDETQSKFGSEKQAADEETPIARIAQDPLTTIVPVFPLNDTVTLVGEANPVAFNVFSYTDIAAYRKTPKAFRDFRKKDADDSYENNIISRKVKEYGKTALQRPGEQSFDKIDGSADFPSDLIPITIGGIHFRAYIDGIEDKLGVSYTDVSYTGIATKAKQFDNINRTWSLTLQMPAFTALDLQWNYKRLNGLMQLAAPATSGDHAGGQIVLITVGDLWDDKSVIIDKVDYTINLDAGWDIAIEDQTTIDKLTVNGAQNLKKTSSGKKLPMYFDVAIGGHFLCDEAGSVWSNTSDFFNKKIWKDV